MSSEISVKELKIRYKKLNKRGFVSAYLLIHSEQEIIKKYGSLKDFFKSIYKQKIISKSYYYELLESYNLK